MVQFSVTRGSCIAITWVSLVSFVCINLCVAFQRVFIFVSVYFVIDSVRKLLYTPSYIWFDCRIYYMYRCFFFLRWAVLRIILKLDRNFVQSTNKLNSSLNFWRKFRRQNFVGDEHDLHNTRSFHALWIGFIWLRIWTSSGLLWTR
jgi:hypothetical protein